MTYTQFVEKWKNQPCEVAGSANAQYQCVDLANAYIRDVLGLPIVEWTNAQDFPKKCLPPQYEYIKNSATAVPLQGDIVVWGSPDKVGHIGICDNATVDRFTSFDQNFPLGSKCHLVSHTYTGTYKVLGWLRCKIKPVIDSTNMTEVQKRILDFIGTRTEGDVREAFGALGDIPKLNKEIEDLKTSQNDLSIRLSDLELKLSQNEKSLADYQSQLKTANKTNQSLLADLDYYKPYKALYEAKLKETADKMTVKQLFALIVKKLTTK